MRGFIAFVVLAAAIVGGAYLFERYSFEETAGPLSADKAVVIAPGSGVSGIAGKLAEEGVISSARMFAIGLRVRSESGKLKAGEYEFPARASMEEVADILIAGKSIQHKLTAAEGLTSQMIYDLVKNDPVLVGDAGPVPDEGTLLPETYLFTRGTTRKELLARMHAAQQKFIDDHWEGRSTDLPYGTKDEAIVLASIVEKETGLASERPHIAGLFANRLRSGMRLQSDPTIIYGITRGYPLGRRIKESEIQMVTPYNTYVIPGLPSQPISNPGKDAILAALKPASTDDIYFVANGTGGHVFSKTIEDQNRNVAAWRKIHNAQK